MLLFVKKKPETSMKLQPEKSLAEFIPYYCHINPHTLLTKNGEVLQIIKIAANARGLDYESGSGGDSAVRETIRRAIRECIPSGRYALWIHTLRKRKPVSFTANITDAFEAYLHKQWQKKHRWQYQYYNEVYITILHDGSATPLLDKQLQKTLGVKKNRAFQNAHIDAAAADLDKTVQALVANIRTHYQSQQLGLSERNGIFYSEPMEFLSTLVNLTSSPQPVPLGDISAALPTHTLTFGFNAIESRDTANHKRFGALLTLKQYREIAPQTADRVLQAPVELIISEAFHFTPADNALTQYRKQQELFQLSGDRYCVAASGLGDMLQEPTENPTAYGMHQVSILALADEFKHLDTAVKLAQDAFADIGLITVREDIRLEDGFWAQLPGNFAFIKRSEPVATRRVGGFSRLNLFPNGKSHGNHWGDAVTLVPTKVGSPYFFNFHHADNGHTLACDFNAFGDVTSTASLHFLITNALKYGTRLFAFDRARSCHLLMDKLGGQYHSFLPERDRKCRSKPALNPLSLEDNPRNRAFLLAWCVALIEPKITVTAAQKALLQSGIDHAYRSNQRQLRTIIDHATAQNGALASAFVEFHGSGRFADLFDAGNDTLDLAPRLHAFDMDQAAEHHLTVPLFSYLLHRIITQLDGKPAIILLHDALTLLDNPFFMPRLESLLEMLRQNNVMVITTVKNPQHALESPCIKTLLEASATQLYFPDDITLGYQHAPLSLSPQDAEMLASMDRSRGDVLLKHGGESIGLTVNLDHMEDSRAILVGDIKNLMAGGGPFASLPKDY